MAKFRGDGWLSLGQMGAKFRGDWWLSWGGDGWLSLGELDG